MHVTDIFAISMPTGDLLVVREQGKRGRPKNTLYRLDGKPAANGGKCPADIARAIAARVRDSRSG